MRRIAFNIEKAETIQNAGVSAANQINIRKLISRSRIQHTLYQGMQGFTSFYLFMWYHLITIF